MQDAAQEFIQARAADWTVVQAYTSSLLQSGAYASPSDVQLAAITSTLLLAVAVNVVLALLLPKGRKVVLDTVETVLAIVLIIVLLGVVLGLPLGIIYLVLKAAVFLLNLVLGVPAVASLVASVRGSVGL